MADSAESKNNYECMSLTQVGHCILVSSYAALLLVYSIGFNLYYNTTLLYGEHFISKLDFYFCFPVKTLTEDMTFRCLISLHTQNP